MDTNRLRYTAGTIGTVLLLMCSGCVTDKNLDPLSDAPPAKVASRTEANKMPSQMMADQALEQADRLNRELMQVKGETIASQERVQQLQAELEEKNAALLTATHDIQAATADVLRTREELQRWKQETAKLRERLQASEQETLNALQSSVSAMEKLEESK